MSGVRTDRNVGRDVPREHILEHPPTSKQANNYLLLLCLGRLAGIPLRARNPGELPPNLRNLRNCTPR
mgnify:FL=1